MASVEEDIPEGIVVPEAMVLSEPEGNYEAMSSNVILVSDALPLIPETLAPQDQEIGREEETTDSEWEFADADNRSLEFVYPDGRCFEEGELELDDDFGEDGEVVSSLAIYQYSGDTAANAEEDEELVESASIKLKKLGTRKIERCYVCCSQFVSVRSLQNHMKIHSEDGTRVTCRFCHRACPSKEEYREHVTTHNGECFFMCNECGKAFHTAEYLERHSKSHQGQHWCPKCPLRFEESKRLVKHLRSHGIFKTGIWDPRPRRPAKPPKGTPQYRCEMCDKLYITMGAFKKHQYVVHQVGYKCDICEEPFPSFSPLREHIAKKHKAGPAMCQYCGKTFNDPWYLKRHEMIHKDQPPLTCEVCGASFAAIGHYVRHSRIHTGEKPFVCSHCGKSFAENGTLTRHERTHTGTRPFPCKLCDKSFTVSHAMKRHMRTHDPVKGYPCRLCSAAYYTDRSLERHVKQKHPHYEPSDEPPLIIGEANRSEGANETVQFSISTAAEGILTQNPEIHESVVQILSGEVLPQEVHVVSSIDHWDEPAVTEVQSQRDAELDQVSDDIIRMEFERRFGKQEQSPRKKNRSKYGGSKQEERHSPSGSSLSSGSEWENE